MVVDMRCLRFFPYARPPSRQTLYWLPHRLAIVTGVIITVALVVKPMFQFASTVVSHYASTRGSELRRPQSALAGLNTPSVDYFHPDAKIGIDCVHTNVSLRDVVDANASSLVVGSEKAMLAWFVPLHRNRSLVCAPTCWLNVSIPGILLPSSPSGTGVYGVFWQPEILHRRGPALLSLPVYSYRTRRTEMRSYASSVVISYASTNCTRCGHTLAGVTAHCVQWMFEEYFDQLI